MRPLWADATEPAAVADVLERAAAEAKELRFAPIDTPADPHLLHQGALIRVRRQLAQRHSEKDRILAQEVRAVDDLVRTANLLVERLREWYALHAPEAVRLAADPERLAALVATHGDRAAVLVALEQADLATSSLGTELDAPDVAAVQGFAAALSAVHASWRGLEGRIQSLMEDVAPNVSAAVGPVLGARLIAQAGSLERLATASAGTVQLYGAETALFRHLKEGTLPPKHGILFQHPAVHAAPPWQRGPAARVLAAAASLAAKADAFTGRDIRQTIVADVEEGLARMRRTHAAPRRGGRGGPRGPRGPGGPRQGQGKVGQQGGRPRDQGRKPSRQPVAGRGGSGRDGGPRRGPDQAEDRGGPRKRGPGAFRRKGGGPAKPPGRGL